MVLLAVTVTSVIVRAQDAPDNSAPVASHEGRRGIEGVWAGIRTPVQCDTGEPTGPPLREMFMFMRGGTATEISNNNFRRSPSVGTWRHLDRRSYTAVWRLFRFNADDSFAGRSIITANIELREGGDEFISTSSVQPFTADDEVIGTFCAVVTATRLE